MKIVCRGILRSGEQRSAFQGTRFRTWPSASDHGPRGRAEQWCCAQHLMPTAILLRCIRRSTGVVWQVKVHRLVAEALRPQAHRFSRGRPPRQTARQPGQQSSLATGGKITSRQTGKHGTNKLRANGGMSKMTNRRCSVGDEPPARSDREGTPLAGVNRETVWKRNEGELAWLKY